MESSFCFIQINLNMNNFLSQTHECVNVFKMSGAAAAPAVHPDAQLVLTSAQPGANLNNLSQPAIVLQNCSNNSNFVLKKHKCSECGFRSIHKWVVTRHFNTKHNKAGVNSGISNTTMMTSPPAPTRPQEAQIITADSDDSGIGGLDWDGDPRRSNYTVTEKDIFATYKKAYDLRLVDNFKIYLTGPSRSGKTVFVHQLLQNLTNISQQTPTKIIWVYTAWQAVYSKMKHLVHYFIEDAPKLQERIEQLTKIVQENVLVVFDDCMNSPNVKYIMDLFTIRGRHNNIAMIFVTQKMFTGTDSISKISQNVDYIVIMKNKRNAQQVQILANQINPAGKHDLLAIYKEATKDKHSYLFIDLTPSGSSKLQYRSHLFDEPGVSRVYVLLEDLEEEEEEEDGE